MQGDYLPNPNRRIANQPFFGSASGNNMAKNLYTISLYQAAVNRFKWENMPEEIDIRYMEMLLVTEGCAIFFFDEILEKYLCLGLSYTGVLDYYGIPIERAAIAANGNPFRNLDSTNSVIIWNNRMRIADMPTINEYANRLWDIERSIIANARQQKFASLILTPETQRLTFQNLMKKYEGNEMFIFGDKNLDVSAFQPLNLNIPFIADKLIPVRNSIYNDALGSLGIISGAVEKRERLTLPESFAPFGAIELIRDSYVSERRTAADAINKMFGLDISVKFNSDIPIAPVGQSEAVNTYGDVYNTTQNNSRTRV